jgi:hypothetical protein
MFSAMPVVEMQETRGSLVKKIYIFPGKLILTKKSTLGEKEGRQIDGAKKTHILMRIPLKIRNDPKPLLLHSEI